MLTFQSIHMVLILHLQHGVMLTFVQRGLTLSQAQRKQRVRNAGWYLNVYRPEVARLKRSIGKLFQENVKLLIRDKQITKEYDNLSKVNKLITKTCKILLFFKYNATKRNQLQKKNASLSKVITNILRYYNQYYTILYLVLYVILELLM